MGATGSNEKICLRSSARHYLALPLQRVSPTQPPSCSFRPPIKIYSGSKVATRNGTSRVSYIPCSHVHRLTCMLVETKVVVPGSQTIHRSPLASCIDSSGSTEKYYMFFVGDIDGKNHVQSLIDGKRATIAVWTPGSFIGAAMHNGKPHLFVNEVFQAVPRLSTYTYDGSSWTSLGAVNTN